MDVPPVIAFRHVEPTEALKGVIQGGIDSLEKVHPHVTSCRVMVEETSRGLPHVRVDLGVPGSELVVTREAPVDPANRDLPTAVREAFDIARRQLREHHKRSMDGKRREVSSSIAAPLTSDDGDEAP